ncbi:MAG TPA: response regulator [Methylomirabilota bacterium]|nr:response regulator [Methylomirabilota bacterium]
MAPDVAKVDVFVLEDEFPVRMVLVEALQSAGYRTTGFGDGAEALERLAEVTPALIMLDMRMPRMDGFQFLTKLRANPDWTSIPVIIVSGLGDELLRAIDARRAESLGVFGIFAKPFDIPTLLRYVASVVAGPPAGRRR